MRFAPRKRFGQHFLVDEAVVTAIIEAINPQQNETLIEIGPGLGALTRPLLTRSGGLTVVELDRDLAARLSKWPKLNVVQADALKLDFATMAIKLGGKLRVIGNLPYNVSTPILFHLMEYSEHVLDQHVMLQKEVVTRMIAQSGNKDYGRLSVMLQWRYLMEAMFDVPPVAFDPPPQVNSTVVRMSPRAMATEIDPKLLSVLVRTAFSQRRKRLSNTLGRWLSMQGYCGSFDLRRRAEEVPVNEYLELAQDTAKMLSQKREGVA